jgi:hypothetical protein
MVRNTVVALAAALEGGGGAADRGILGCLLISAKTSRNIKGNSLQTTARQLHLRFQGKRRRFVEEDAG